MYEQDLDVSFIYEYIYFKEHLERNTYSYASIKKTMDEKKTLFGHSSC